MLVEMLKSKILRAETTDARIDYEGSLAIDLDLMDKVGMLPYEKILVGNISNGKRFETIRNTRPARKRHVLGAGGGGAPRKRRRPSRNHVVRAGGRARNRKTPAAHDYAGGEKYKNHKVAKHD